MLRVCSCAAPLHLLRLGLFPCAPVRPTLAVDLNMLEYVKELFVRSPPNITAWCDTLEAFLGNRKYKVSTKVRQEYSFIISCTNIYTLGWNSEEIWKCTAVVSQPDGS